MCRTTVNNELEHADERER